MFCDAPNEPVSVREVHAVNLHLGYRCPPSLLVVTVGGPGGSVSPIPRETSSLTRLAPALVFTYRPPLRSSLYQQKLGRSEEAEQLLLAAHALEDLRRIDAYTATERCRSL